MKIMKTHFHRSRNIAKTWILMAGFFVFVIGVGWVFSQIYGDSSILVWAVIFSVIMNVLSYWFSDKLVLLMSRAKPIAPQDNPELYRIIGKLTTEAGLSMPRIYLIDEVQPNAFATGRNSQHSAVAVTRGLLSVLNEAELEGVIAHELSHIGNRDILVSTIAVVLAGFVALVSDFFLRMSLFGFRGRSRDRGQLGGIMVLIGIVLSILAPLIATLIRLAISRKREFLADASGVSLTRRPESLASALEKISANVHPLQIANHATAHLFIANPFRGREAVGLLTKLFQTHPPVQERIRRLREM